MTYKKHLILNTKTIKDALELLNAVGIDRTLFSVNERNKLEGSISDGDIRRGLLNGITLNSLASEVSNKSPKFLIKDCLKIKEIKDLKNKNYDVIPVLNDDKEIIDIISFKSLKSFLPMDVVVMAGGLGSRLKPLTDKVPKPLLKIGNKAVIDHNIDRMKSYGVKNFWISINYLGDKIKAHFVIKSDTKIKIEFIEEAKPLGTIGAVGKINNFINDNVLITNSDILTNLDYESFFEDFIKNDADMSVVTIPYDVNIPYAVIETDNDIVLSFKEKPKYTYYSNGGIYLVKKSVLKNIPKNKLFNATDLMNVVLEKKLKLISFPITNYWLDIGSHEDFKKAKRDINNRIFQ